MSDNYILSLIKSSILKVLPQARVSLFGSRAYGIPTEESDWDILILTQHPVDRIIKKAIHDAIFPVSVQIGSFINTLTVQEDDWENSPCYYSLHQTVAKRMTQL